MISLREKEINITVAKSENKRSLDKTQTPDKLKKIHFDIRKTNANDF